LFALFSFQAAEGPDRKTEQDKRVSAWGRDKKHGEFKAAGHVVLTTHPRRGSPIKIVWGAGKAQNGVIFDSF
jgi:hypothetical protein